MEGVHTPLTPLTPLTLLSHSSHTQLTLLSHPAHPSHTPYTLFGRLGQGPVYMEGGNEDGGEELTQLLREAELPIGEAPSLAFNNGISTFLFAGAAAVRWLGQLAERCQSGGSVPGR